MASKDIINVTICGGGNGAHTLAGIASLKEDVSVTVLDVYEDEPERWSRALKEKGFTVNLPNGDKMEQFPGNVKFKVTRDVGRAVSSANVVILVCPAYAHEVYLELIVGHLSEDAFVVGMPGQPGFEYQCLHYLRRQGKRCSFMGLETLPWACRINEYGHNVTVLGFKDEVESFVMMQGASAIDPFPTIQKILGKVPVLKKASNALEIILASKAIIHPPILYAKWKDWNGEELEEKPLFYQGVDKRAVDYLEAACNELVDVAEVVKKRYPRFRDLQVGTMYQWLVDTYGDQITDTSTLLTALQTTRAYDGLVHPMKETDSGKYVPDFTYRYMREDVAYGIVVQRTVAEMVGVKTPVIDEIITWAQGILGVEYLVDGRINDKVTVKTRIPQMYGLNTIDDLLNFFEKI